MELLDLAATFARLGATSFGGPAAHIAMMEDEFVRRRRWLSHAEFLDVVGATNLIPGPNSTEMAMHLGQRRAGLPGLVVAGTAFIAPAFVMVLACAMLYVRVGTLPEATRALYGIKPAIIAIVAIAFRRLGRTAIRDRRHLLLLTASIGAQMAGANEVAVLLAAGVIAMLLARPGHVLRRPPLLVPALAAGGATAAAPAAFGLWPLFLLFESRRRAVRKRLRAARLSPRRSCRALALVERCPTTGRDCHRSDYAWPGVHDGRPSSGTCSAGSPAAVVATVGIFLPAFVFVGLSGPLVPRIRRSPAAGAFLDGVNVASLALMAVVIAQLGRSALVDPFTLAIAAGALYLLLRRVNATWLVLAGALAGAARLWL